MIAAVRPRPLHLPPAAPGAFSWRYLDLVDDTGSGAVLIWGWALPFLRPDPTGSAADLPTLNLAVYQAGQPVFYHLEQLDPGRVERVDGGWRFGDSVLRSECIGPLWRVRAELDLPIAGSKGRALGVFDLDGPAAFGHPAGEGHHRWSILSAAAQASLHLRAPGLGELTILGRGYHDENSSDGPLSELGISEWAWGRVAEPDHERVHYLVEGAHPPVRLDVRVEASGRLRFHELSRFDIAGRAGGRWGYAAPSRIQTDDTDLTVGPVVDESSFYLRFGLTSPSGRGWGERVRPAAIDSRWMQTLVQMCVTRPGGASPLLPWFSGARADRVERTCAWWTR